MKSVFYSAQEVAELIGCSPSKAYEIIRKMNAELEKGGYVTFEEDAKLREINKNMIQRRKEGR